MPRSPVRRAFDSAKDAIDSRRRLADNQIAVFVGEHQVGEGATGIYCDAVTHAEVLLQTHLPSVAAKQAFPSVAKSAWSKNQAAASLALTEPVKQCQHRAPRPPSHGLSTHSPVESPFASTRRSHERVPC